MFSKTPHVRRKDSFLPGLEHHYIICFDDKPITISALCNTINYSILPYPNAWNCFVFDPILDYFFGINIRLEMFYYDFSNLIYMCSAMTKKNSALCAIYTSYIKTFPKEPKKGVKSFPVHKYHIQCQKKCNKNKLVHIHKD